SSRVSSSVPLQSLAQLNSEFALGRATALAKRIERSQPANRRESIRVAYRLALGRDPTIDESTLALWFLADETPASSSTNTSIEPVTAAVATVAPANAAASSERLVEFCQMLLASNAFLYLE
ncbi:MAG: DUF1553 domain-containing protein, partial [Planctomycetaceae bacterium]